MVIIYQYQGNDEWKQLNGGLKNVSVGADGTQHLGFARC